MRDYKGELFLVYDERLYDGDVPLEYEVTGRCDKCREFLVCDEEGWNGEDGASHFPEYDTGGGNFERLECGPVFREGK